MNAAGAAAALGSRGLQFGLLAALFAAGMARTWGQWPDALVDFGREIYTPWRLVEGDRLYRDVAWFNGPLSPYWNAALLRVFGVGLSTLVWANAALFALLLALLHALLRAFVAPWAATGSCALVLACCGFAQLVGIGNYNYLCPYSHEATHGLLLTLAALWAAQRWGAAPTVPRAALAGAFVGLAFLTKPEMALAALVGGLGSLAFHAWSSRLPLARQWRALAAFAAAATCAVAAAVAALALAIPAGEALRGVVGPWGNLAARDVAELEFYKRGMGLDDPSRNAWLALRWLGRWSVLLGSVVAAAYVLRRLAFPLALGLLAAAGSGYGALWAFELQRLNEAPRPWPLLALAALLLSARELARGPASPSTARRAAFALAALALLAKMALNVRLSHYGFALAMPATALLGALALDAFPRWVTSFGAHRAIATGGAAGIVIAFGAAHVRVTSQFHGRKSDPLGAGRDAFVGDVRARLLNAALGWLERTRDPSGPERTLAVFPEGVMLNYLARLDNPTPYVNFMPPEILLFGEERIVAAFRASPPDVVIITHKSTAEYGFPWFGVDYAPQLGAWLRAEYQAVQVFGDPPLQPTSRFGVAILVRRD